jgi:hypothetical protein
VQQHDAGPAAQPRVAVAGMRRHLLMPAGHKGDRARLERVQNRDVRVAAEAEDELDAVPLELVHERGSAGLCLCREQCAHLRYLRTTGKRRGTQAT